MKHKIVQIWHKYYEVLKAGLLVGVLISNLFALSRQAETLREVRIVQTQIKTSIKEDNKAREESRRVSAARDQLLIDYIGCLWAVPPAQRTGEIKRDCATRAQNGDETVTNVPEIDRRVQSMNIPQNATPQQAQQQAKDNTAAQPQKPTLGQSLGNTVDSLTNTLDKTLGGIL